MRDLPQFMARGIEIRQIIEVTNIAHIGPNIGFFDDAGLMPVAAKPLLAPLPQSARLLTNAYPNLAATAQLTGYDPCWTIMLSLEADIRNIGMAQDQISPCVTRRLALALPCRNTL